ncbi:N-acetyltransferase NAT13 [Fasciola gigantica]|uniref:N-terminal methionine N(alpha)-acetyltransferase NatE n=1 Tax=Fasciola gigantica TaxID=46835 RepID=A0A504YK99_FASGI|nr:N-acetyltransferase NAT13 [Fasciola gigantica]
MDVVSSDAGRSVGVDKKKRDPALYRIELGQLTAHNIKQLRLINQVVLPVSYAEKFYTDLLKNSHMCRLAYFNDIVVGAVSYRVDNVIAKQGDGAAEDITPNSHYLKKCYIMTLGCLAPYRGLGIGTVMLKHVVRFCKKHGGIRSIYLHVHVENSGAVAFYKRFGFDITGEVEDYYRCVEPKTAYILEKNLSHSDYENLSSDSD